MLVPILVVVAFAVQVADLPPGAVLRLGDTHFRANGEVRHLRFTDDGTALFAWATGPAGQLRPVAWNAATGISVAPPSDRLPPDIPEGTTPAVPLKGDRIVTAGPGNAGRVWDATTARQLARLMGHTGTVTAVALSADGKRIATGSADGLVRLWDADTFRPLTEPRGHTAAVISIRVSLDGKKAATVADDGSARVWDLATGKELRAFNMAGPVEFTADGLGLVLEGKNGTVTVRDIVTGAEIIPDRTPRQPRFGDGDAGHVRRDTFANMTYPTVVSPDGRVQARTGERYIALDERETWRTRRVIACKSSGLAIAFTPDGTRLLTAESDHTVLVWDVRPRAMPLPDAVRRETNAAKLWATMCVGPADAAYLAMARLAAEPEAAVKTARMRMRPADADTPDSRAQHLADTRAIELLESLGTPEAWEFILKLAAGEPSAFRTREAKRALERMSGAGYKGENK